MNKILYHTVSVCPKCLRQIPARIIEREGSVYMDKICPEHGRTLTLIWQDTAENYLSWLEDGGIDTSALPHSDEEAGAMLASSGFDLTAEIQPCSSALMTTTRCNMNCPVCFTKDRNEGLYEPSLEECAGMLDFYRDSCGEDALLELCGGEPTVRKDLPEIARMARERGFEYVQLNTNGKKLAESAAYCRELKEAGVTTVYLGFDGFDEKTFTAKYGENISKQKDEAVRNCAEAGLAVVLVPCVIPGANDDQLGAIIDYAIEHSPAVRGVYFQPVSYFGIYPGGDLKRITIPGVIRKIEAQTGGRVKSEDFLPGAYEHAACTFQATYVIGKEGSLSPLNKRHARESSDDGYKKIRRSTKLLWLPSDKKVLFIGGMAFQDAGNIDLIRIKRCSVQIIGRDGTMIPLCSKYLTDEEGGKLHPGIS
jgi:uncharacterized radical SAM superfamily Fe-S cluster-containing enzyme